MAVSATAIIWCSGSDTVSEITTSALSLAVSLSYVAVDSPAAEHLVIGLGQIAAFVCKQNEPAYEPVVWATTAVVYNIVCGAMAYYSGL